MTRLEEVVARLEELFAAVDAFDEPMRSIALELLDGVDAVHRVAIEDLARALGPAEVARLRIAEPSVRWLLEAYGVVPGSSGERGGGGPGDGSVDPPRREAQEVPVVLRPTRKG